MYFSENFKEIKILNASFEGSNISNINNVVFDRCGNIGNVNTYIYKYNDVYIYYKNGMFLELY